MNFKQKLGASLREWRKEAELTQRELADKTGLFQGPISRWEAGINLPSIRDLVELADFYHITLDELIDRHL